MITTRHRRRPRAGLRPRGMPGQPRPGARTPAAVVPYDYAASFELTGEPGNVVQDVINVSPDGVFVAVAIGYGFDEDRARPVSLRDPATLQEFKDAPADQTVKPGDIKLGEIPAETLLAGFRAGPEHLAILLPSEPGRAAEFTNQEVQRRFVSELFEHVRQPEKISFLLSIVDSASGREFQDLPTHSLAALGSADGKRPFRPLAHPIAFMPRSSLRLQVIEQTEGVRGTLFIVLYGYTLLGTTACPEPVIRSLRGSPACPIETIGRPSDRYLPFDYVATLELSGRRGATQTTEVPMSTDGGFVATWLGYGLATESRDVSLREAPARVNLAELPLKKLQPQTLIEGFRVRPSRVRVAFRDNGQLATIPLSLANTVFESLNHPDDVSFRYTIFDGGRARDLQNQPIHNVAGLGIANGDRPFKRFARPLAFLPRSTIRVTVEERFGRGTLYLVFQGYKLLGQPATGGRP